MRAPSAGREFDEDSAGQSSFNGSTGADSSASSPAARPSLRGAEPSGASEAGLGSPALVSPFLQNPLGAKSPLSATSSGWGRSSLTRVPSRAGIGAEEPPPPLPLRPMSQPTGAGGPAGVSRRPQRYGSPLRIAAFPDPIGAALLGASTGSQVARGNNGADGAARRGSNGGMAAARRKSAGNSLSASAADSKFALSPLTSLDTGSWIYVMGTRANSLKAKQLARDGALLKKTGQSRLP